MNKRILLIVPDHPLTYEFIEKLQKSFDVVYKTDEEAAYAFLSDPDSDVSAIIESIDIARENDFAFCDKVNNDILYAPIPIIGAMMKAPTEEDMDCLEHGMSDLINPPLEWTLIAKRIENNIKAKDSLSFHEVEKILKQLPSNIYLKDKEGKYILSTKSWHHFNDMDTPGWTIRGKKDVDIRKNKENALRAQASDEEVIRTGIGKRYIINEDEDGVNEYFEVIKQPIFDEHDQVNGVVGLINDVTEIQLLRIELEKQSKTDYLTALLNRSATEKEIDKILADKCAGAFLMIDVDHFKNINDTYGHESGDVVLKEVGRILKENFKGKDVVGRIGGDEFLVFVKDVNALSSIRKLVEKILEEVNATSFGVDHNILVTLSIGIALSPEAGKTFEELYRNADHALYQVKEKGRNGYQVYNH